MQLVIRYFYNREHSDQDRWAAQHKSIQAALRRLQETARIHEYGVQEHKEAFPTGEDEREFFKQLADFSLRHHVALAQIFGSRKHGFSYLPPQFLLVYSAGQLAEVFPCRVGNTEISILDFLARLEKGEAWTSTSYRVGKKSKHEEMIERILDNPATLEAGLTLHGKSVHVSQGFGEVGIIDLVFLDKSGTYLLVEVKVKPDEIDKAIGQVLRHRDLFARQNFLERNKLRIGIACPFIPVQARAICEAAGIEAFELSKV